MSWVDTLHRLTLGREERRPSFLMTCLGRIAFIIFALVFLALYIQYNGPVV